MSGPDSYVSDDDYGSEYEDDDFGETSAELLLSTSTAPKSSDPIASSDNNNGTTSNQPTTAAASADAAAAATSAVDDGSAEASPTAASPQHSPGSSGQWSERQPPPPQLVNDSGSPPKEAWGTGQQVADDDQASAAPSTASARHRAEVLKVTEAGWYKTLEQHPVPSLTGQFGIKYHVKGILKTSIRTPPPKPDAELFSPQPKPDRKAQTIGGTRARTAGRKSRGSGRGAGARAQQQHPLSSSVPKLPLSSTAPRSRIRNKTPASGADNTRHRAPRSRAAARSRPKSQPAPPNNGKNSNDNNNNNKRRSSAGASTGAASGSAAGQESGRVTSPQVYEVAVVKCILEREGQLRRVQRITRLVNAAFARNAPVDYLLKELFEHLIGLRTRTVAAVESISEWQQAVQAHDKAASQRAGSRGQGSVEGEEEAPPPPPPPFVWDGANYMQRMCRDIDFLADVEPLRAALRVPPAQLRSNPFMSPKTLSQQADEVEGKENEQQAQRERDHAAGAAEGQAVATLDTGGDAQQSGAGAGAGAGSEAAAAASADADAEPSEAKDNGESDEGEQRRAAAEALLLQAVLQERETQSAAARRSEGGISGGSRLSNSHSRMHNRRPGARKSRGKEGGGLKDTVTHPLLTRGADGQRLNTKKRLLAEENQPLNPKVEELLASKGQPTHRMLPDVIAVPGVLATADGRLKLTGPGSQGTRVGRQPEVRQPDGGRIKLTPLPVDVVTFTYNTHGFKPQTSLSSLDSMNESLRFASLPMVTAVRPSTPESRLLAAREPGTLAYTKRMRVQRERRNSPPRRKGGRSRSKPARSSVRVKAPPLSPVRLLPPEDGAEEVTAEEAGPETEEGHQGTTEQPQQAVEEEQETAATDAVKPTTKKKKRRKKKTKKKTTRRRRARSKTTQRRSRSASMTRSLVFEVTSPPPSPSNVGAGAGAGTGGGSPSRPARRRSYVRLTRKEVDQCIEDAFPGTTADALVELGDQRAVPASVGLVAAMTLVSLSADGHIPHDVSWSSIRMTLRKPRILARMVTHFDAESVADFKIRAVSAMLAKQRDSMNDSAADFDEAGAGAVAMLVWLLRLLRACLGPIPRRGASPAQRVIARLREIATEDLGIAASLLDQPLQRTTVVRRRTSTLEREAAAVAQAEADAAAAEAMAAAAAAQPLTSEEAALKMQAAARGKRARDKARATQQFRNSDAGKAVASRVQLHRGTRRLNDGVLRLVSGVRVGTMEDGGGHYELTATNVGGSPDTAPTLSIMLPLPLFGVPARNRTAEAAAVEEMCNSLAVFSEAQVGKQAPMQGAGIPTVQQIVASGGTSPDKLRLMLVVPPSKFAAYRTSRRVGSVPSLISVRRLYGGARFPGGFLVSAVAASSDAAGQRSAIVSEALATSDAMAPPGPAFEDAMRFVCDSVEEVGGGGSLQLCGGPRPE